jgi:hypothetical protein
VWRFCDYHLQLFTLLYTKKQLNLQAIQSTDRLRIYVVIGSLINECRDLLLKNYFRILLLIENFLCIQNIKSLGILNTLLITHRTEVPDRSEQGIGCFSQEVLRQMF